MRGWIGLVVGWVCRFVSCTHHHALTHTVTALFNEHYYVAVDAFALNFTDAEAFAQSRTLFGASGHLVSITSAEEHAFVAANLTVVAWIGINKAAYDSTYNYTDGPEAGLSVVYTASWFGV